LSAIEETHEPAGATFAPRARTFLAGSRVAFSVPGLILCASAAGFGALARDGGLSVANALLMMAALFALPAQVVLLDTLARGGSLLGGALAVALTGIRLVPMTVTLAPLLGTRRSTRLAQVIAVHAVAVTAWIEGFRRLPHVAEELRTAHFLGIGAGLIAAALGGTLAGFVAAGTVPALLAAALLFLTPIYFMLSLMATAGIAMDRLAIACGTVLGPVFYHLTPGFDLLATGVAGGTIAYALGQRWEGAFSVGGGEE
jgi:predicted branched-subunit amino acid permease